MLKQPVQREKYINFKKSIYKFTIKFEPLKDMCKDWDKNGGIIVLGYTLFRMLTTGKNVSKKTKRMIPKFKELILKNCELVICDEGHQLKNAESAISKACKEMKTLRRVVLTGTPMQNNLDEYHVMCDFVRPNLLGTNKGTFLKFEYICVKKSVTVCFTRDHFCNSQNAKKNLQKTAFNRMRTEFNF